MRAGAIVVAAGAGDRLGAAVPKALVPAAGRPLVVWSVDSLVASAGVGPVVVVAPPGYEDAVAAALGSANRVHAVVPGGATRQRSVAAGLAALPDDIDVVLVHDAARPLLTSAIVDRILVALGANDAAIAAVPIPDTLKRAGGGGLVEATVDRSDLWGAQTPQGFRADVIRRIFAEADEAELDSATDCAGMAERRGVAVALVDPGAPNLKVTTPADLALVVALLGGARIA